MSKEQSFLNPDQQQKLFDHLKAVGALSSDIGQAPDTQDPQAQQGIGNIDFATLQSLLKHSSNPDAVPMQPGDKIHPMDAISQISQQLAGNASGTPVNQPQAPSGIELASGPQIIKNKRGELEANTLTSAPLGHLLGIHQPTSITGPNYYRAAKQAGIDQYLPQGLMRMPDGTPYVGAKEFTDALTAHKGLEGQGNELYTKAELVAQGIPEDKANEMLAAAVGAGRKGVTHKEVGNLLGTERIAAAQQMADARTTMAGVSRMSQILKVQGFDALQPLAENAGKNLGAINRAQAVIDQITANGGKAIPSQAAELGAALGQVAGSSSGVLTDEKMNKFIPESAMQKYGSYKAYWQNANEPIDFTGFLPQMQDLITREKQKNQENFSGAQALGIKVMGQTQPNQARIMTNNLATSPIVGTPKATGGWKVIR